MAAALVAAGCGFQMRGGTELPDTIRTVHVQGPSVSFENAFELLVESGGADVVKTAEGADAVFKVTREHFDRRVLSVDAQTGKAREYELSYTIDFSMTGTGGETYLAPQSVTLVRDFVFDPDAVLGMSREEAVLQEEMRRDAAQQILWRLRARFPN